MAPFPRPGPPIGGSSFCSKTWQPLGGPFGAQSTSDDIAKLLNLSGRNLENHRYRIGKNLSLSARDILYEF